jgi:Phosphoesterase family
MTSAQHRRRPAGGAGPRTPGQRGRLGHQARRGADAGEPLLRPLLRRHARRARLRRPGRAEDPVLSVRRGQPRQVPAPFHTDTHSTSAQNLPSNSHSWGPQHQSWDNGKMDGFVTAHLAADGDAGQYTMAYFQRADVPFHWALATVDLRAHLEHPHGGEHVERQRRRQPQPGRRRRQLRRRHGPDGHRDDHDAHPRRKLGSSPTLPYRPAWRRAVRPSRRSSTPNSKR